MGRFDELVKKHEARKAATGANNVNPASRFNKLARYAKTASPDVADIDRILSLPIIGEHTPEQVEEFSHAHLQAVAFEQGERFLPTQSSAIDAYLRTCGTDGGGFFPIGVGWGKTGISLYIAELAHRAGTRKIMLLVPPQVFAQLTIKDVPYWRRMVNLSVPIHRLGGQPAAMRKRIYESDRRGLYIVPYSLLSVRDTLDMLTGIDPDLVIADEVHNLKNRRAARTKRLFGWRDWRIEQERPPAFVGMSGTITSKKIEDYHHLITWALGDGSPLPKTASLAYAWAQVIDSGSSIVGEFQTGPLKPLTRWAQKNFSGEAFRDNVSDFRRAYKLRLTSAPGVVSTGDAEIGTSLIIETAPIDKLGAELLRLMLQVKDEFLTPNGDEIDHAIHTFKWLNELSAGFYNELIWPTVERTMKRLGWRPVS